MEITLSGSTLLDRIPVSLSGRRTRREYQEDPLADSGKDYETKIPGVSFVCRDAAVDELSGIHR